MGPTRRNCFLVASILLVLGQAVTAFAGPEGPGRRMLVGFRSDKGPQTAGGRAEAVRGLGGLVHRSFDLVPAVAAELAEQAMEDGCHLTNPRKCSKEDMVYLYNKSL